MQNNTVSRPGWLAWSLLLALGIIWGGSFTVTGAAVEHLPPMTLALARLLVAAVLLIPLSYIMGQGLPSLTTQQGRTIWLLALCVAFTSNALPFSLLSWAQIHITSGLASVFMTSLPLIVMPLAVLFIPEEKWSWTKIFGLLIGFAGVLYLIGFDILQSLGGEALQIWAQLACLLAAFGYASGSILTKFVPVIHPTSFGSATALLAILMLLPAVLIWEEPLAVSWSGDAILSVTALGIFPTALAMILLYEVIRCAGPSFLSLVNYQVPLWALFFGVIFREETIPSTVPVALLLILGGVAISQDALAALYAKR